MTMNMRPQIAPVFQGDHSRGNEDRTVNHDSKVKLQITGPDNEMLYFDGPPEGKKWAIRVDLFIKETDA